MTTDVLEKVAINTNGDKYWVKEFSAVDSIEHVKLFERQKLDAKIKCGLELLRAKLIIGYAGWYKYLFRCGMSPPTASRRKSLAVLFLKWCGILKPGDIISETHIIQGLELAFSKSFKMNDFQKHLFELNYDDIVDSLQEATGGTPSKHSLTWFLGFDFKKVLKSLNTIEKTQHEWADHERSEVINALELVVHNVQQVITDLTDYTNIKNGNPKELSPFEKPFTGYHEPKQRKRMFKKEKDWFS